MRDDDESAARDHWGERLNAYLDGQEGVEALRDRVQPNPPWPGSDNPMVGYLVARALEISEEHGVKEAIAWAVVYGWYESAIDTRASLIRGPGA